MKKEDMDHLIDKLINGGSGVWGEVVMPAHPALSEADAQKTGCAGVRSLIVHHAVFVQQNVVVTGFGDW